VVSGRPSARYNRRVRLLRKLATALDAPGGPVAGDHVLAAVSGGPDSTALVAGLAELAANRGLIVTAAYVDHGLRGAEGASEGIGVAALARQLGVGFVARAVLLAPGRALETRARQARYRALAVMATAMGASWIVTGHTRDDQVETVLMRLLRGAGRRGLGAMAPRRGRLLRPLLEVSRADVRRFLAERALPFALDRTNADLVHVRNRVRRLLVPLLEAEFNPQLSAQVARLATRMRDEDEWLNSLAADRASALRDGERLRVAVAEEPPALGRRVVRDWLGRRVSAGHVERVLALAARRARGAVAVPGPARVVREREWLVLRAGRQARPTPVALPIVPGATVEDPSGRWRLRLSLARSRRTGEERARDATHALLDADALPPQLLVRSPRAGDRIHVLGLGTRKVQDVLVDAKVPREGRPAVPLLVAGDQVLWVAGVLRGSGAMLDRSTRRVVEALYELCG